jgi:hypothetical protein
MKPKTRRIRPPVLDAAPVSSLAVWHSALIDVVFEAVAPNAVVFNGIVSTIDLLSALFLFVIMLLL